MVILANSNNYLEIGYPYIGFEIILGFYSIATK